MLIKHPPAPPPPPPPPSLVLSLPIRPPIQEKKASPSMPWDEVLKLLALDPVAMNFSPGPAGLAPAGSRLCSNSRLWSSNSSGFWCFIRFWCSRLGCSRLRLRCSRLGCSSLWYVGRLRSGRCWCLSRLRCGSSKLSSDGCQRFNNLWSNSNGRWFFSRLCCFGRLGYEGLSEEKIHSSFAWRL